jgi:hypothetical protein
MRVLENGVLRRILGPERDEKMGVKKTTERGALYASPYINWMIKLSRT